MIAWLFPGQGSQEKGMGGGLFDRFPKLVAEADEILGYSSRDLCLHDVDGRLRQTSFAQPAIYLVNALYIAALRLDGAPEPSFCAGHSLGEFSALYAAGAFDFIAGLHIVKERGKLFEQCNVKGGMAAVLGVSQSKIRAVLRSNGIHDVDMANLNSASQTVIAGPSEALTRAKSVLEGCALFHPLAVSGPFHSRYLTPLRSVFAQVLASTSLKPLQIPVIANATARPYEDNNRISDYLCEQIDHPVRWNETIRYLWSCGVNAFREVGHGHVLTRLYATQLHDRNPMSAATIATSC